MISAPATDHARLRKALGPGFSQNYVRSQEPVIMKHIDSLINILHKESNKGKDLNLPVKLAEWINFTAFDIMGDLAWGVSFNCLSTGSYHPWILVASWYKGLLFGVTLKLYPLLGAPVGLITPPSAKAGVAIVIETSKTNLTHRLKRSNERPDLMSSLLRYNEKIIVNFSTIIVGGSDPLTSVVAGCFTYMLRKPEVLACVESEIRSSFKSENEINVESTKKLIYLHVVLLEALRLCPPVPDSIRRAAKKEGMEISGYNIPGDIVVGVTVYAALRAVRTFTSPDEFLPERWLDSDFNILEYPGFYPFGFGPRSCPGQALAWAEMNLLVAKLLWNFDIRDTKERTVRP
ncbi:Cytochrome P450 monooxygenase [Lachnellula willkommii]|uniref:Cytochrome P450 monooxygenase n=1 Tax=Lachnellula willkommii TaxID=215461 RepID=A0A559MGY4_9HELO|nr:Cytochrome P450 monooxygenase [Lachnellula willkommii]